MTIDTTSPHTKLRQLIGDYFNHDELITLCYDLRVPERKLRSSTDDLLIIDLINLCYKESRIADLITRCQEHRPLLDWPDPETIEPITGDEETRINGDFVAGDKVAGDKVAGNKLVIDQYHHHEKQELTFPLLSLPLANPNFTGRDDLLTAIQDSFANQQASIAITQAIAGLGGIGKTQLALAYAYTHRTDYDLIWWLNAESEPALTEALTTLGRTLHLPVDTLDRPAALGTVLTWITSTNKRWLLIYDNVDSLKPRDLRPLLPGGQGHVLITSRNPNWRGLAKVLDVKVFTPEEAVAFLHTRLGLHYSTEGKADELPSPDDSWKTLAEDLGYLPLALEHAAAYMEARGKTAAEYTALFRQRRQELWDRVEAPDAYHATITTTWDMAFDHARQTPGTAALLNLCCFLAPDDIPLDVIRENAAVLPEELAVVLADDLALDDALTALTRFSLLTKQDGMLAMHRLVQTVARDQMGEEREREWLNTAVTLMNQAFPFQQNDLSTWEKSSDLLPHMLAVSDLTNENNLADKDVAYLCNELGGFFNSKGEFKTSFIYMEHALAIYEQALGPDHPATAQSMWWLGIFAEREGDLAKAKNLYRRALTAYETALGTNHPNTISVRQAYKGVFCPTPRKGSIQANHQR